MIPGKKYDPGTRTSRRPTPERFVHLRRWVEPVDRNIEMTSVQEITNIDQQIEQISRFYVSNIIQRVIAQLTAQFNDGFRTLKCTKDGHLIVKTERETKVQTYVPINHAALGDNIIVPGEEGQTIHITGLVLVVAAENDITLKTTTTTISGPMPFGGDGEPWGMVDNKGFLSLTLPEGDGFIISLGVAAQVTGYVSGWID
ncbi:hypothetical protein ES705_17415 [subsurface metagenome]